MITEVEIPDNEDGTYKMVSVSHSVNSCHQELLALTNALLHSGEISWDSFQCKKEVIEYDTVNHHFKEQWTCVVLAEREQNV